ncbi:S8 family peptidase [Exiguobacterium profundum]|uniref:S8 family peptidase n=1 Tax=Exiguobacterium TaxID=33986 RepID=UPI001BFC18A9|nr:MULTISPECIES: S8 family peptidase [Exiguobacterium]MCT4798869.1 S8 family peptidase [Exiguobacterium profundum]
MKNYNNFLLGNGERLTEGVKVKKNGGEKNPPYEWGEAKEQVKEWLTEAVKEFEKIPIEASPSGEVSAVITMHPRYTSKSDFPKNLFESVGIRAVGGRSKKVKPRSWGIEKHPEAAITDEIFVVGTRENFQKWAQSMSSWSEDSKSGFEITHLEEIKAFTVEDKIKLKQIILTEKANQILFEFVLHEGSNTKVLEDFKEYSKMNNADIISEKIRRVGNLTFVPVYTNIKIANQLAQFTYVRVLRSMPQLRTLTPDIEKEELQSEIRLSEKKDVEEELKIAVFDGGIPKNSPLLKWVNLIEPDGIGAENQKYLEHGLSVTSALLFGSLELSQEAILEPMFKIDHIRVLDENSGVNNDFDMYDVLDRITSVIDEAKNIGKPYDFINLSLGPDIPVEDDEINSWTASLDIRLVGNESFVTVAAGNSGETDVNSGSNRIQPPSDAVNVLTVGSCDTDELLWERAPYSSIGPGRCPGIIKPDGVVFGGSLKKAFGVLGPGEEPLLLGTTGTSFAAPSLLRSAINVRNQLGISLSPIANRALFIHKAHRNQNIHKIEDVGWGRFETDLMKIITCGSDEAIVIYQGELPIGEHLRARIPMPNGKLKGMVSITASLVISPEIDPSYPNNYTKAGLEIAFRPNSDKRKLNKNGVFSEHAETKSFFNRKGIFGLAELELREDGHKWEPCLKATRKFRASTLVDPAFDIYYHHRAEGQALKNPKPIPYALVIGMKAPKVEDFYNRVFRTYSNILVPLSPKTQVNIRS